MRKIVEDFINELGPRERGAEFSKEELKWMGENNVVAIYGQCDRKPIFNGGDLIFKGALKEKLTTFYNDEEESAMTSGTNFVLYFNIFDNEFCHGYDDDEFELKYIPEEYVVRGNIYFNHAWRISVNNPNLKINIYEEGSLFSECVFIDLEYLSFSGLQKYEKQLDETLGHYKLANDGKIYYGKTKEEIIEGIQAMNEEIPEDFYILPSYVWPAENYAQVIGEIMEGVNRHENINIGDNLLDSSSHLNQLEQRELFIKFIISFVRKLIL